MQFNKYTHTHTHTHKHTHTHEDGHEDEIGEGGGEAKMRKKPHKSCRRYVGNGGDLGERGKNVDLKGFV